MLQRLGIRAGRKAMYTGVWVGNKKLAAIGIGVRHWITFHGMALNICNDLTLFSHIIPCGITEFGVTSVQKQGCQIALTAAIPLLLNSFTTAFPHNTYTHFSDWGGFI
jgi:lipoyl(octanoyl) transferase